MKGRGVTISDDKKAAVSPMRHAMAAATTAPRSSEFPNSHNRASTASAWKGR